MISVPTDKVFDPEYTVHPVNEVAVLPVYWITPLFPWNRYPLLAKYIVSSTFIVEAITPLDCDTVTGFWKDG